ncbi:MAG TPA: PEP-CTERM sorting domain-containing protein [Pirellulales bacterium]|nr:PEP-CTERM sorting domain-containing protein [Pirellulales bacterium]
MLVFVSAAPAWAQLSATATISTAQTSAPFNYTIQLHNTGTTTIGTLWFAWIPLGPTYNFLSSQASNITVPTGWTGFSTGTAFGGDGYGIEMYDIGGSGDLIASGGNATFGFTDSESHTQLMQNANFITSDKVTTSFIYVNSPEGDPGFQFNVQVVPEPSGMVLAGLGGLAGLTIWRRRRAAAA